MIASSIIKKSQLEGALRLDAEYYQQEYFIDFSKGNWQSIGDCLSACEYGLSLAMNDEKIGYPMFKMDDINDGFLFDDDVRYADIPQALFEQFKLQYDDVLFNRVNSIDFVGRTGIYKLKRDAVFASYLIRLQVKKDGGVLSDYLNIFLNSKYGRKQINKYARRAVNQANVNAQELQKMKIAVVPLNVQQEVAILSTESWQEFEKSESLYSQAGQMLLGELGLRDFVVDNELYSVVKLSEAKEAGRMDAEYFQPKYEKMIAIVRENGGLALGELATLKKGFEPGSEAYEESGKLFIRVSSISKQGLVDKDQKYINDKLYQELKKEYEPKKGEILLTKDATPGIAYAVDEPVQGIIAGGILRLKLKTEVDPEYVSLCINSIIGQMQVERDAGGSIIAHWKPEQVKNLLIPILPKSTQQKIAELVRASHAARKKAKQLLEEAKQKVEEMIEKGGEENATSTQKRIEG